MDSRVTVRFYSVIPLDAAHPSFEASLNKLMGLGDNPSRDLGNDVVIQASHLKENGGHIAGDLVRIQSTSAAGEEADEADVGAGGRLGAPRSELDCLISGQSQVKSILKDLFITPATRDWSYDRSAKRGEPAASLSLRP